MTASTVDPAGASKPPVAAPVVAVSTRPPAVVPAVGLACPECRAACLGLAVSRVVAPVVSRAAT